MKVTAILKDKADCFYAELDARAPVDAFNYLNSNARGFYAMPGLSMKVGSGQFRDAVELNSMRRKESCCVTMKRESRRGYQLVTFEFSV